jgi:hypothetical protein
LPTRLEITSGPRALVSGTHGAWSTAIRSASCQSSIDLTGSVSCRASARCTTRSNPGLGTGCWRRSVDLADVSRGALRPLQPACTCHQASGKSCRSALGGVAYAPAHVRHHAFPPWRERQAGAGVARPPQPGVHACDLRASPARRRGGRGVPRHGRPGDGQCDHRRRLSDGGWSRGRQRIG